MKTFKLINRDKFITVGSTQYADKPSSSGNNFSGRVYPCTRNLSQMDMFERLWFDSELYMQFGKYRRANIGWFLLCLFFPFLNDLYEDYKEYGLLGMTFEDFIAIVIMLCGLGFVWSILRAYFSIRRAKKDMEQMEKENDYI